MRFQQIGLAIATVAFVSGCSAGRRPSVNMVEDVDVPATHRSQYAPEYPSPYERSGSASDSDEEQVPLRPLPESLRRRVKSVTKSVNTDTRVSDPSAAADPHDQESEHLSVPVREAGLLRWQSADTNSAGCSVEEGCHGQPAGTSLCHRLRLLFRQQGDCSEPDPYAFCGTMTFEETLAGRRMYYPHLVPAPSPDPDISGPRSFPFTPDRHHGGGVPVTPREPRMPDEGFPPGNLPEEINTPESSDIVMPPELPATPRQESDPRQRPENEPLTPPQVPGQEGNYVDPPMWFRKVGDPSRSEKTPPAAPEKQSSGPSAEAVYPEPEEGTEFENNATSDLQELPELAPDPPRPIGPTSLPAYLKPAMTRGSRKPSRL